MASSKLSSRLVLAEAIRWLVCSRTRMSGAGISEDSISTRSLLPRHRQRAPDRPRNMPWKDPSSRRVRPCSKPPVWLEKLRGLARRRGKTSAQLRSNFARTPSPKAVTCTQSILARGISALCQLPQLFKRGSISVRWQGVRRVRLRRGQWSRGCENGLIPSLSTRLHLL